LRLHSLMPCPFDKNETVPDFFANGFLLQPVDHISLLTELHKYNEVAIVRIRLNARFQKIRFQHLKLYWKKEMSEVIDIDPRALMDKNRIIGGKTPLLPVGNTYFYYLISIGKFPKPVKIGKRSFWVARDVFSAIQQLSTVEKA